MLLYFLSSFYFKLQILEIFKVKTCQINFSMHIEILTSYASAIRGYTELILQFVLYCNQCLIATPAFKLDISDQL